MSLKTLTFGSIVDEKDDMFSSPYSSVPECYAGNEFKNYPITTSVDRFNYELFSSPPKAHSVQASVAKHLLGDRRKYPCGIRGMSLKTRSIR